MEISGVEVDVTFQDDASPDDRHSRKRPRPGSPAPKKDPGYAPQSQQDRSTDWIGRKRRNGAQKDTLGEVIPTTHDLAKSFLDQEPKEERAQLQAELASRSVDLTSTTSSETTEDSSEGTGVGFALPSFLAGFLADVANRLQIKIRDISIKSTMRIDAPIDTRSEQAEKAQPSFVTFLVRVAKADIEGLTTETSTSPKYPASGVPDQQSNCHPDSRSISLESIDTFLALDRDLLHMFSQTSYKDGLSKGEASAVHSWANSAEQLVDSTSNSPKKGSNLYTRAVTGELANSSISGQRRESEPTSPLQESLMFTDGGNVADAEDDDESVGNLTFSHEDLTRPSRFSSRSGHGQADMRESTDSMMFSRHKHDALSSFRRERSPSSQPKSSYQRSHGVTSPRFQKPILSDSRFSTGPDYHKAAPFAGVDNASTVDNAKKPDLIDINNNAESGQSMGAPQSKTCSQQEDDSVYMSFTEEQIDQNLPLIPGAWGSESFYDDLTAKDQPGRPDKVTPNDLHALSDSQDHENRPGLSSPKGQTSPGDWGRRHTDQDQNEKSRLAILPLLSVDHLRLWLPYEKGSNPGSQSPVQDFSYASRAEMPSSASGNFDHSAPGAFSLYAESVAAERQRQGPKVRAASSNTHSRVAEKDHGVQTPSTTFTKVSIGSVNLQLDPVSLKIFHRAFRKCQDMVDLHSNRDQNTNLTITSRSSSLDMSLASTKISFAEDTCVLRNTCELKGLRKLDPSENVKSLFDLNLGHLSLNCDKDASKLDLNTDVQHVSIEYASRPLLRFDPEGKMKASVRDRDLGSTVLRVSFRKNANATETDISSSAVVMNLNFVELDQTLVSFGGFSGLLDLGSSILSETGSNNATISPPRHKAVHFDETQERFEGVTGTHPRQKINLRIGGSSVTMIGETCRVDFQSSAIKVVGRDLAFAVQIDESTLVGPTTIPTTLDEAVRIQFVNLSLKFLTIAEEKDLSKLISLLSPSKDKFEEEDDYLVETLISQRRKGSVMRVSIANVDCTIPSIEKIRQLSDFAQEITKLSTVTKYLPQETRPGVLTIASVGQLDVNIDGSIRYDRTSLRTCKIDIAHVSTPSLVAVGIGRFSVHEDKLEKLLHQVTPSQDNNQRMLMARFIGEEMEPTVKVKLWNVCIEYSVPLIMKAMGLHEAPCTEEFTIDLAASVANFADHLSAQKEFELQTSAKTHDNSQPLRLNVSLRDCGIGLKPRDSVSKALLALSSGSLSVPLSHGGNLDLDLNISKASLLLIDDTGRLKPFEDVAPSSKPGVRFVDKQQMERLTRHGYVSVCWVSAASVIVKSHRNFDDEPSTLDVEIRDELFVLETCADSTQTLIQLIGALQPPQPPSTGAKYRTEVEPIQDMMASFTGDAYAMAPKSSTSNFHESAIDSDSDLEEDLDDMRDIVGMMNESEVEANNPFASSTLSSGPEKTEVPISEDSNSLDMDKSQIITGAIRPAKLKPREQGMGCKWNSNNNRYVGVTKSEMLRSPFKFKIKDMTVIWNLHDGYDWQGTRDTISNAVGEVEAKAEQKRSRAKVSRDTSDDEESVIGDYLFNSIYIGVPANHDPRDLARQINRDVDENVSESTSQPTTVTARPAGAHLARPSRRLKLGRSKRHKITIELRGLSSDVIVYPSGGETLSSTDVRVKDIEVFDHVPTSTWKKFATYWHESAPREDKKPMAHVEVCDVRPVPELTASELVIRVCSHSWVSVMFTNLAR